MGLIWSSSSKLLLTCTTAKSLWTPLLLKAGWSDICFTDRVCCPFGSLSFCVSHSPHLMNKSLDVSLLKCTFTFIPFNISCLMWYFISEPYIVGWNTYWTQCAAVMTIWGAIRDAPQIYVRTFSVAPRSISLNTAHMWGHSPNWVSCFPKGMFAVIVLGAWEIQIYNELKDT